MPEESRKQEILRFAQGDIAVKNTCKAPRNTLYKGHSLNHKS